MSRSFQPGLPKRVVASANEKLICNSYTATYLDPWFALGRREVLRARGPCITGGSASSHPGRQVGRYKPPITLAARADKQSSRDRGSGHESYATGGGGQGCRKEQPDPVGREWQLPNAGCVCGSGFVGSAGRYTESVSRPINQGAGRRGQDPTERNGGRSAGCGRLDKDGEPLLQGPRGLADNSSTPSTADPSGSQGRRNRPNQARAIRLQLTQHWEKQHRHDLHAAIWRHFRFQYQRSVFGDELRNDQPA